MSTGAGWDDDLLPETTSDERGGWGERGPEGGAPAAADSNDERLEEDRPPHW